MPERALTGRGESIGLLFPGQGSQFPGMAAGLAERSPAAKRVLERADDILGYRLTDIIAGESVDELNRTTYTQPAVFVHSTALLAALEERTPLKAAVAAGHSLGEYSALCAAGVVSFEDALDIVRVRAESMDAAQPPGSCAMAAIVGLPAEKVVELVRQHRGDDVLEAANFNAPDQVVVSGRIDAVNRLIEAVGNIRRTRAVMLPVSSAFHTILMEPARKPLAQRWVSVDLTDGRFPVAANVTGELHVFDETLKQRMVDQILRPVRWTDCIETMRKSGVTTFVEIGPGKVLTGLLKRIDRNSDSVNLSDFASIEAFTEQLQ